MEVSLRRKKKLFLSQKPESKLWYFDLYFWGEVSGYEQPDHLVTWRSCWVSSMISLKMRNLAFFVSLECGAGVRDGCLRLWQTEGIHRCVSAEEWVCCAISHCAVICGNTEMEITLILYLDHHESYSLGLICILKLLMNWSSGVGVAALVHVKLRVADDIYLQLCLGFWLNHCAETSLGSDRQQLLPPSPVYPSLHRQTAPSFQK